MRSVKDWSVANVFGFWTKYNLNGKDNLKWLEI